MVSTSTLNVISSFISMNLKGIFRSHRCTDLSEAQFLYIVIYVPLAVELKLS